MHMHTLGERRTADRTSRTAAATTTIAIAIKYIILNA